MIHPTLVETEESTDNKEPNAPKVSEETNEYDKAKEIYEEAKEAYQIALENLSSTHSETETMRKAMIEAREAFLIALGNDKIEEES